MRVLAVPRKRLNAVKNEVDDVERRLSVSCAITRDGNVEIEGAPEAEWVAEQVLRAVALGFEAKHALKLLDDDFFFEEIDLSAAVHGSRKALSRYKARLIGTKGKIKRNIEALSGAHLVVGEDAVAILGRFDDLKLAREAVFKILEGKEVSTVYAFLEKQAKRGVRGVT